MSAEFGIFVFLSPLGSSVKCSFLLLLLRPSLEMPTRHSALFHEFLESVRPRRCISVRKKSTTTDLPNFRVLCCEYVKKKFFELAIFCASSSFSLQYIWAETRKGPKKRKEVFHEKHQELAVFFLHFPLFGNFPGHVECKYEERGRTDMISLQEKNTYVQQKAKKRGGGGEGGGGHFRDLRIRVEIFFTTILLLLLLLLLLLSALKYGERGYEEGLT